MARIGSRKRYSIDSKSVDQTDVSSIERNLELHKNGFSSSDQGKGAKLSSKNAENECTTNDDQGKIDDSELSTNEKISIDEDLEESNEKSPLIVKAPGKQNNEIIAKKKPGVVYINHPPVFMKPVKVRHLMSQYGTVGNLFLQPEDVAIRNSRSKRGGSPKIKYKEGWIEFTDRKVAKAVAVSLNGKPVGGPRRSFHHESLWNLKYLPEFKWEHLVEMAAYEKNIRRIRLRTELAATKRENEYFLEKVAEGKRIKAIVEKKEAKRKSSTLDPETIDSSTLRISNPKFKQLDSLSSYKDKRAKVEPDSWLTNIMS